MNINKLVWFIFFSLFISTILNCVYLEATSPQEYNALCAIATSIPLLNSTIFGWSCHPANPCSWKGIMCNTDGNENITSIDLDDFQLSGTIPTQIGQLKYLTFISFYNNQLSGTIPTQLSQITDLNYLSLSENNISGTIPTQIGQLKYLTFIEFDFNQLSGTIPTQLLQITNLLYLSLFDNQISGTIPTQLSQININYLVLDRNEFSGTIPTQIGQLKYLTFISLYYNQLSGTIPTQLLQITSLQYLSLTENQINGTIPTQIGQLISLTHIEFDYNQISGTIPTQIGQLISLTHIEFEFNQISGTIPTQIGQLISLTLIDFHFNQISGTIPTQIEQLRNLTSISLQNTQLCGCPQLPSNLKSCNLLGIPHSCNCSILALCSASPCNNSFNCILGSTPLSIPSIQTTPQPSTPLSIPSIQTTPQPSLNVGCLGNYGTLFTCKDGMWNSITDIVINGTNLLKSNFNISTLIVNGNTLISESSINIVSNLFIQKSILTLQNCSLFVSGNLYISPQSTIILNTNNNFIVNHCAFLNGSLVIITQQSQALKRLPILYSQCINGTFSSVSVNLTDTFQCNVILPYLEHLQGSLIVYFEIVNNCNLELQLWIYIITGIVGLLLLVVVFVSAILIKRNMDRKAKKLLLLCQKASGNKSVF